MFAALYLITALPRVVYPYDLDFVEDGMLLQAWQSARGLPVFGPPNADFTPNVYMPLFTWLGGWLLAVFGPGYAPLRLLSFAATLTTAALVGWIVRRESGRAWLGLACTGLYLGGYRLTGFWYELARVDSLHTMLAVAGLALGVYSSAKPRGMLASAGVLALAFFTKQTAVIFAAALGAYFVLAVGRRALWFAAGYAASTLIPFFAINAATHGWFVFHTFGVATADPIEAGRVAHYVFAEVFGVMGAASVLTLGALILTVRRAGLRRLFVEQPWFIGLAAAGLVSGLGRAPVGGNLNNLMPVYALLCLAPGWMAREWADAHPITPASVDPLIAALILLQFALGVYNPLRYVPTPEMRVSGDRFIQRLRGVDGNVLVLMHPYYALLAGKAPSTQIIHLWYLYKYQGRPLPEDLVRRIREHYYAIIVSDQSLFETEPAFRQLIEADYKPVEMLEAAEAPATTAGLIVRPQVILQPGSSP